VNKTQETKIDGTSLVGFHVFFSRFRFIHQVRAKLKG